MIGFIKGLFGSNQQADKAPVQKPEAPVAPQKPVAFFLDADSAQTLGDIDYMRTAKAVKRTFPKTVNNEEMKTMLEISSSKRAELAKKQAPVAETVQIKQVTETGTPKADNSSDRRRTDTSMDTFRNMAKDIKKR